MNTQASYSDPIGSHEFSKLFPELEKQACAVLEQYANGQPPRKIASHLNLDNAKVGEHLDQISEKLGKAAEEAFQRQRSLITLYAPNSLHGHLSSLVRERRLEKVGSDILTQYGLSRSDDGKTIFHLADVMEHADIAVFLGIPVDQVNHMLEDPIIPILIRMRRPPTLDK